MKSIQIFLILNGLFKAEVNVPAKTIQFILNLDTWQKLINENHFVNFTGATFVLATYVFTLACIRVVYINKFVARHENLCYRKYSLEKNTMSNEQCEKRKC